MTLSANKRSVMTLYSKARDVYSHRARLVLAEKNVTYDVLDVDINPKIQEELASLNPYGKVPTLVDRELVLYRSSIIVEYLDERFPHPPLLPVYPVSRARSRLMIYRIDKDWYGPLDIIEANKDPVSVEAARKKLLESMLSVIPVFSDMPYFLSEEFSLVDCSIAVLLWRLPVLGIELPSQAKAIEEYAKRMFDKNSFQASLTDSERTMRM